MSMKVAVLGAGNAGTTLAKVAAEAGNDVILWTIEQEVYDAISQSGINKKYLDGVVLPDNMTSTMDMDEALAEAGTVMFAVPSHVVRKVANQTKGKISPDALIVDLAKGIEEDTLLRMSQVIEDELGKEFKGKVVGLSGPMIANELSHKVPTAVSISSEDITKAEGIQKVFDTEYFQLLVNEDTIGVELGGALKNIIAIGAGLCDGMGYGVNTKSALVARGLSEITLLGTQMGAKKMTFLGLAGLGDLYVTCTSEHSRNRTLGEKIGKGQSLEEGRKTMVQVAEGVVATRVAYKLGKKYDVDLPLTNAIHSILFEGAEPRTFLDILMSETEEVV